MEEDKSTTEVRETTNIDGDTQVRQQAVTRKSSSTTPGGVIFQRIVWYVTGVIVVLLGLRLILQLLGANDDAEFVNFIYSLSNIFAAPFYGIFSYQPVYGKSYLEVSTIVAIVVYLLVGWGIAKLATITRPNQEA